jgi:hypothetical protein
MNIQNGGLSQNALERSRQVTIRRSQIRIIWRIFQHLKFRLKEDFNAVGGTAPKGIIGRVSALVFGLVVPIPGVNWSRSILLEWNCLLL